MQRILSSLLLVLIGFIIAMAAFMAYFNIVPSLAVQQARAGKLEGKLIVQWLEPDKFRFLPDTNSPLRFTRSSGTVIQPHELVTDGGTIPRALWVKRNYSPWGYAPAFIIHDWLFEMKRCNLADNPAGDYREAAVIMAEVMKTMAEAGSAPLDTVTLVSMHAAVTSNVAREYWESGLCETDTIVERSPADPGMVKMQRSPRTAERKSLEAKVPLMQYEISF